MKRKIILVAHGTFSTAKVTLDLVTDPAQYMRDETATLANDIADELFAALSKKYRATKIKVHP